MDVATYTSSGATNVWSVDTLFAQTLFHLIIIFNLEYKGLSQLYSCLVQQHKPDLLRTHKQYF